MKQRWIMMEGDARPRCTSRPIRTVLVTGGAGYIGSSLIRGLLSDGLRVRALDSFERGDAGVRSLYTNPDFELIRGDIRRVEPVVRAVRGADAVIHLAGVTGQAACRRDESAAMDVNVAATSLLIEVCRGMGVARLVLASTLDVYGTRDRVVDEASTPEPRGLYAATQLDAERLALAAGDGEPSTVVFRLGQVFGVDACPNFDRGLNRMTAEAWRRGRIADRPGGRRAYWTHVSDVCAVMRQALVAREEVIAGQVFNVGCEQMRFTWSEIGALLAEAAPNLNRSVEVARRDLPSPTVSFQKLRGSLGVACRGSMRQGLAELLLHLRRGSGTAVARRPVALATSPSTQLTAAKFLR